MRACLNLAIGFVLLGLLGSSWSASAEGELGAAPALPVKNEWRYLSFEQRHAQMTFLIHPAMMERFQEFYQTKTPELTCETCHGENAEARGYNYANSDLVALSPTKVQSLYRVDAKLSPEQTFKRDIVTPTMARLMEVPPYDPSSGLGFSCFGCHRAEEE